MKDKTKKIKAEILYEELTELARKINAGFWAKYGQNIDQKTAMLLALYNEIKKLGEKNG